MFLSFNGAIRSYTLFAQYTAIDCTRSPECVCVCGGGERLVFPTLGRIFPEQQSLGVSACLWQPRRQSQLVIKVKHRTGKGHISYQQTLKWYQIFSNLLQNPTTRAFMIPVQGEGKASKPTTKDAFRREMLTFWVVQQSTPTPPFHLNKTPCILMKSNMKFIVKVPSIRLNTDAKYSSSSLLAREKCRVQYHYTWFWPVLV